MGIITIPGETLLLVLFLFFLALGSLGYLVFRQITTRLTFTSLIEKLKERITILEQEVMSDPLTGFCNQRGMNFLLHREIERTRRQNTPISALFVDIDLFKNINDTYGHAAGDFVLSSIRERLQQLIRAFDIACRYGGDELVVILPDTSLNEAIEIAERIRKGVSDFPFFYQGEIEIAVTFSIGVATLKSDQKEIVLDFLKRADEAMYRSKTNGRNQVSVSE